MPQDEDEEDEPGTAFLVSGDHTALGPDEEFDEGEEEARARMRQLRRDFGRCLTLRCAQEEDDDDIEEDEGDEEAPAEAAAKRAKTE